MKSLKKNLKMCPPSFLITILSVLFFFSEAQAINWSSPQDLSPANQKVHNFSLAADPFGNFIVVWQQTNPSGSTVQTSSLVAETPWSTPSQISSSGQNAINPYLILDSLGNATAIWKSASSSQNVVQVSFLPFGGSWSEPTDILQTPSPIQYLSLASDASGNVVAVWQLNQGGHSIIQSRERPFGRSWLPIQTISTESQDAVSPQLAMSTDGTAIVVWYALEGKKLSVQVATRPSSRKWSAPKTLSLKGEEATEAKIAMNASGHAIVVWKRFNAGNFILQVVERSKTGSWTLPLDLSKPKESASFHSVAIDRAGTAFVVWSSLSGEGQTIQAARRPPHEKWRSIDLLSSIGSGNFHPQISIDVSGNAVAVWENIKGNLSTIQASISVVGERWGPFQDISSQGEDCRNPQVVIDPSSGTIIASWIKKKQDTSQIQVVQGTLSLGQAFVK